MLYYGFDPTYLYLVLPCVILSLWASANVNRTFQKYQMQFSRRGLTAAEAAQRVLSANGVRGVSIQQIPGSLNDHFDPTAGVIRLSQAVYGSTSTAAIGVACHEAGHAIQYAVGYAPIKLRAAIIPITNLGSKMAMPLILLGLLFGFAGRFSYLIIDIGIACFALSLLFQLVTLPVEFDASRRAMKAISDSGLLSEDEQQGARNTLRAAALTYVAATALSLAQVLRLVALFGRRKDD